ncbi:hypothetical protein M413DRAFT_350996 [Hebeloma cylindrosporum]|uniref:Uncharacterized protein n=1 Tax=Hebeloma cylindrosporum TaxID=76867 RepID=A0A0C3BV73_HEBCY|nr:hypothetical protein M413DRAFT_350996 [Hebeloma cylindrosporum h7]
MEVLLERQAPATSLLVSLPLGSLTVSISDYVYILQNNRSCERDIWLSLREWGLQNETELPQPVLHRVNSQIGPFPAKKNDIM